VKVLPRLRTDLTDISPSKTSQIVLQILRPNPIPLILILELERNLPKTLKSFSWSSSEIPIPVSVTLIMRLLEILLNVTMTEIEPFIVNFRALLSKLRRIYLTLCSSVIRASGTESSQTQLIRIFFSFAAV
jgi:hypothetical protein